MELINGDGINKDGINGDNRDIGIELMMGLTGTGLIGTQGHHS